MSDIYHFGHEPVVPPVLVTEVPRVDGVWFERFATVTAGDVADAVGPLYTMSPDIRPLSVPQGRLVGQALTAKAWPGDSLAIHGALALAKPGDVLVVDSRGYVGACGSGAQVLALPARRGLRGVVIDGGWRDLDDLQTLGFPLYGRASSLHSPPKRRPGEINVPVACGGVVVQPGDIIIGDSEGIVVVPRAHISMVWAAVEGRSPAPTALEEIERRATHRSDVFRQTFADSGGVEKSWAEGGQR